MAGFFQACSVLDEIECKELLLRRYSNIEYILSMDILQGLQFVLRAKEKAQEERLYMQWIAVYPYMDEKTYISFEDFYNRSVNKSTTTMTNEEILAESEAILRKAEGRE